MFCLCLYSPASLGCMTCCQFPDPTRTRSVSCLANDSASSSAQLPLLPQSEKSNFILMSLAVGVQQKKLLCLCALGISSLRETNTSSQWLPQAQAPNKHCLWAELIFWALRLQETISLGNPTVIMEKFWISIRDETIVQWIHESLYSAWEITIIFQSCSSIFFFYWSASRKTKLLNHFALNISVHIYDHFSNHSATIWTNRITNYFLQSHTRTVP